jgi:PAS domain S-box-containing protein
LTPGIYLSDSPARRSKSRAVLTIAASVTITVGVVVLLGWSLDIDGLRRFLPGVTNPMVGATASCFVLLGTALLLLRASSPSRARTLVARALSLAVVTVGLLAIGEYAFGWDLQLDHFLYRDSARPFTGAMAVPTAITFVCIGSALLALASGRDRAASFAQVAALVGGIVPLLTLAGRVYGVPSLSSFVAGTVVMALHTGLTFLILVVGILALRPDVGVMRTFTAREPGGWLLRTLLIPAWGVVFLVGWLRLAGERAGYYGTEFGTSAFAIASIVLLTALMLLGSRSLNRAERERRATESKLVESEHRGQAVLASMGEGILTTDAEGLIVSANPAVERITGRALSEIVGRSYAEALTIVDGDGTPVPPEERHLARAMASGEVVTSRGYDTAVITEAGTHLPVAITAAPILDQHGRVVGGVDVIRDVSHEREVDMMKSSLVSTVSHELRTPLTMIEGFSELLVSRDLDPERAKHAAHQIHDSALRLDRLIEDLLSVSRIDSGSIEVRGEPIHLHQIVGEVVDAFAHERSVEVELDGIGEVFADPDMVHRILMNLVSNAIKYSPAGGRVVVTAEPAGGSASVSVSDSGIGLSTHETEQLFEKFFRADRPEVHNARGTGLGLYITRNLVELQGGRIAVESRLGEGTTFTFTLPLASGKGSR